MLLSDESRRELGKKIMALELRALPQRGVDAIDIRRIHGKLRRAETLPVRSP